MSQELALIKEWLCRYPPHGENPDWVAPFVLLVQAVDQLEKQVDDLLDEVDDLKQFKKNETCWR